MVKVGCYRLAPFFLYNAAMENVILWLIAVYVLGFAVFPLCYHLFPGLRDRGYSIAKPFGILLCGYLSWILSVLGILPSMQLTLLLVLAVLVSIAVWLFLRSRSEFGSFFRQQSGTVIFSEVVFVTVFAVWALYRSLDPSISHTAQPMDFMFFNASVGSLLGTPEDTWLRGEAVSYYYFGYWNIAMLTKLTGIQASITYNLALALIPALGAMGVVGLLFNLAEVQASRLRHILIAGVIAVILLVFVANLEGILEFMRANGLAPAVFWNWIGIDGLGPPAGALAESWMPTENWWWWRATRVISSFDLGGQTDYTIHEFPAFSYILGDLHPHVMSLPFVVMFIGVVLNFYKGPRVTLFRRSTRTYLTLLVMGFVLGGLGFGNMWDLPIFAAALVGVAGLKSYAEGNEGGWRLLLGSVLLGLSTLAVAGVLYSPYFLSFTSQVSGIGALSNDGTRPVHFLLVWGLYIVAVTPFLIGLFWRTTVHRDWRSMSIYSVLVGFLPFTVWVVLFTQSGGETTQIVTRLVHVLPFSVLISMSVYTTLWLVKEEPKSTGKIFSMSLAILGLLLIMGPELLFVNDSFGGAFDRMNTVFKFYYQAWILMAIVSGFAVYYWFELVQTMKGRPAFWMRGLASTFILLLATAAYYVPAAMSSKSELTTTEMTLNGLQHVERSTPSEYRAIQYIINNVGRDSGVLEAVGGGYTEHGRISASTGVPTVLGWPGHELQWRGSSQPFDGREADVRIIYETTDKDEALSLLARYDTDYIYLGHRERWKYDEEGFAKFDEIGTAVFSDGDVVIYKVK